VTLLEQLLQAGAQQAPLVEVLLAAVAAVDTMPRTPRASRSAW